MSGRVAHQPAWVKLVATAAILAIAWILGQTMGHVLLVFTVSTILALLLNPLVRQLRRLRIPRGVAVLMVFTGFAATAALAVFLVISPVRTQIEEIEQNLPAYTDQAERQADELQTFFDARGIDIDVKARADAFLAGLQERASEAAANVLDYSLDVLGILVTLIIILVASIYMLLDAPRILRFSRQVGGPETAAFLRRVESTLTEYVKAQLLVSLIIGTSAGVVLWVYGVTGLFPLGATFAVAFAAWVFVMEFVPYVGPILGAVPPVLLALFTSPLAALWVVIAFIVIHQLEGHIVVPKVMSSAVGVHPLVVIFGLLIGEQLAGVVGVLLAIPVVVVVKEAVTFLGERLGEGAVPVTPAGDDDAGARAADVPGTPPPAPPAPVTATRELPARVEPPTLRHPT
ncbi:AI-2E family transporter [Miltoncostaea oceani]|uniref:AI-2E family transporter n=1 Tax=Miltoncostaea oceani TaxID=2843216 RepID=UPI001C3E5753|nr:AI-2E family transporter [Miltoncostaea oceani]